MCKLIVFLALTNFGCVLSESTEAEILVEYINSLETTWRADYNFDKNIPTLQFGYLCGALKRSESTLPTKSFETVLEVPDFFDARKQWLDCASISDIRDQGCCGSCWAHGTTEAISDRICIQSKGQNQTVIGAEYVTSCCKFCGSCNGGFADDVWGTWVHTGLITGGGYNSYLGCQPYEVPPGSCPDNQTTSLNKREKTPRCVPDQCTNSNYATAFSDDFHFGQNAYNLPKDVEQIQNDIFQNGPVSAYYNVYEDFIYYKSGVYSYINGTWLGGHVVKILGWGMENETPYWLVANSWNASWGDEGYFKILRGNDECGIESGINAGV